MNLLCSLSIWGLTLWLAYHAGASTALKAHARLAKEIGTRLDALEARHD